MNRSLASIEKATHRVKAGLELLGIGLGVGAIVEATKRGLEYAGSLDEVAQQIGLTVRDLQTYRYAASQVGVSNEELDKGLQKFTKSLGDARNGSKDAIKLFKALGFTPDQIKHLDIHDALLKTADGLHAVTDRASRGSVEVKAFGRAGQQLDTFLAGGSAKIKGLAEAAERLGLVLSDRDIQNAHETAIKLSEVKQALEINIARTVAENADSILSFASALGTLTVQLGKFLSSNPQVALGLLGTLVGSRGGVIGAGIGATAGVLAGERLQRAQADSNLDPAFRRQQLDNAMAELRARQGNSSGGFSIPGIATFRKGTKTDKLGVQGAVDEVNRQAALMHQAAANIRLNASIAKTGAGVTAPPFLAGDAHSKLQPKEFINQSAQLDERLLRVKEQMATDTDAIAGFVKQQINVESAKIDSDILENVNAGHLTGLQGEILLKKSAELRAAELLQAEVDRQSQVAKDTLNLQITGLDDQKDLLSAQASITRTAAERRAVELKLLALDKQEELLKLDNILADKKASDAEKAQAQKRKDDLDKIFAARAQSIIVQNAGPLEDYLRSVPNSIAQINEAMQRLRVDQFDKLNQETKQFADDLSSAVGQFGQDILDLKNPLTALKSLLTSVAHTFQQEFLIKPLTDAFRKKIGAPLAEKLVTANIGGQTVHGVAGDFGLSAQQMNLAFKTSTSDLLAFSQALTMATGSLGGGLNLNGFGGFPSGSIATDSGFQSMVAGLSNNGASIGIDPSELAAVNDNLDVMSGVTAQATSALQAQIPALGQFGNGLLNVLSSLAGGGASGGGGLLGQLLQIGGSIAGGIGGASGGLSAVTSLGGDAILFAAGGGEINRPTLVGEHGPEMFMPKGPGSIIPAPQTAAFRRDLAAVSGSGGGGDHHHYTFNNYAKMTDNEARRTGAQNYAGARAEHARAARTGIAG